MRRNVTREQLITAHRLLAVGPFVGTEQHATKATAAQLEQPFDAFDRGFRITNQRRSHLDAIA